MRAERNAESSAERGHCSQKIQILLGCGVGARERSREGVFGLKFWGAGAV